MGFMNSSKNKLNKKKKNWLSKPCQTYFTKNWKHCSKIIFKCVNNVVWPFFNESLGEKEVYGSRKQCTRPTGKDRNMFLKKKKKKPKCRHWNVDSVSKWILSLFFASLFYYSAYFCYYSWVSLYFLVLFMDLTVLFQLIFTFIYSTIHEPPVLSIKSF